MPSYAIILAASAMGGRREVGPRSNRGAQKRRADHGGYSGALKPFPWSKRPPEASVTSQKGRSW